MRAKKTNGQKNGMVFAEILKGCSAAAGCAAGLLLQKPEAQRAVALSLFKIQARKLFTQQEQADKNAKRKRRKRNADLLDKHKYFLAKKKHQKRVKTSGDPWGKLSPEWGTKTNKLFFEIQNKTNEIQTKEKRSTKTRSRARTEQRVISPKICPLVVAVLRLERDDDMKQN